MNGGPPPIIENHTLHRIIGSGAYGDVWLASDAMGAWRAVKIVRRDRFRSERPYDREFAGIEKMMPLSRAHPAQVDILAAARNDAEGWFYYIMELADDVRDGQQIDPATYGPRTLASDLAEHERLPAEVCLTVGVALATALENLHAHGLVHRDIKPANIIFVHGLPKLADIGLVTDAEQARTFVGTEGYLPPEGPGTMRADIFSLGRVLYQMHTGLPQTRFPEVPTHLGSGEDAALAREFNLIMLRACAPEPAHRHTSPAELREELQLLQSGRSIQRLRDAEGRAAFFKKAGLAAAVVAVLALVAGAASWKGRREAEAARGREAALRADVEKNLAQSRLDGLRAQREKPLAGRKAAGLAFIRESARAAPSITLASEAAAHLALWDIAPGREWPLPEGASEVDVDPAREHVATLDAQGCASLWQPDAGGALARMWREETGRSRMNRVKFSEDGRFLLLTGEQGVWRLLDVATGRAPWNPAPGAVMPAFALGGRALGVWEPAGIVLRECASGAELERAPAEIFANHPPPEVLAFHPTRAVLGFTNGNIWEIWRWDTWQRLDKHVRPDADSRFTELAFSRQHLASADPYGLLMLLDMDHPLISFIRAQTGAVDGLWFSQDGRLMVYHAADGARVFDLEKYTMRLFVPQQTLLRFDASESRVAFRSARTCGWHALDAPRGFYNTRWWERREIGGNCRTLQFSDDDRQCLAALSNGVVAFDPATGATLTSAVLPNTRAAWLLSGGAQCLTVQKSGIGLRDYAAGPGRIGPARPLRLDGEAKRTEHSGAFNPACGILAASYRGQGTFFHTLSRSAAPAKVNAGTARAAAISPDGKFAVLSFGDGQRDSLLQLDGGYFSAAHRFASTESLPVFSPDGRALLIGSPDSYSVYESGTWRLRAQIPTDNGEGGACPAAWSGDGSLLAVVKKGRFIEVLDARTLEPVIRLETPDSFRIEALAFSHGGRWIAVGGVDAAIAVWDLARLAAELSPMGLDRGLGARVPATQASWKQPPAFALAPDLQPHSVTNIPPRPAEATARMLDLTSFYNHPLGVNWHEEREENLLPLPPGVQRLGGVEFDVRGIVQLTSTGLGERGVEANLALRGVSVGQPARRIHFLGATCDGSPVRGDVIGKWIIHYTDGVSWEAPVHAGIEMLDWWRFDDRAPDPEPHAPEVWTGQNPLTVGQHAHLRLCDYAWKNPRPDVPVATLDFVSDHSQAAPFIVAVTVE